MPIAVPFSGLPSDIKDTNTANEVNHFNTGCCSVGSPKVKLTRLKLP